MYRYQRDKLEREKNPYNHKIKIENLKKENDVKYVALMGSMAHSYGNVLAFIQNWILNLFPENTFKTIHVNSKIAHRQLKSTPHEFLKKTTPSIVFRPRISDMSEDRFLKGTWLIEKQTDIYSTWGATSLQPFFSDPKNNLSIKYQLNRSVLFVDVVTLFPTQMQQINFFHYLQNAIRVNQPFDLSTFLESYIPQEMLYLLSNLVKIPLYDELGSTKDFLTYLSGNSAFPVTYKLQGSSGTREFYRYYPANIFTTISDVSIDDGERSGHVTSNYQLSFSIRLEFNSTGLYYLFSDKLDNIDPIKPSFSQSSTIIPLFTDVRLKEDLNLRDGWRLYNTASCRLEDINDSVNITQMFNTSILKVLEYHKNNGLSYFDVIDVKIRRQGKLIYPGKDYIIDWDTFDIKFKNQNTFYTYNILLCVNIDYINELIKTLCNLQ